MSKTYLIFRHEFLQTVKGLGFSILTFAVPILGLLAIGVIELVTHLSNPSEQRSDSIGYVDEVGMIDPLSLSNFPTFVPLATAADATKALVGKEVSEYIVISSDYTSRGVIRRFTLKKEMGTPWNTAAMIKNFLTVNLLNEKVSGDIVTLVVSPLDMRVTRLTEQGVPSSEQSNIGNVVIPAVFALLLGFALTFGASSLVSGLGEEKESRLIEVLLSSVSIRQLLVGKILALGTAGLLQVLVWLLSAPLLLNLASSRFGGFMSEIQIPGNFLLLGCVYFILGYLLFAVLSVGIGAISPNAREGGQLSLFYILFGFSPLWISSLLFSFPNSSAWAVLTIFPITAPVQTMLRLGVSDVPLWQLLTSFSVLGFSIMVGLFLAIKVFRIYMLMYGNRPRIGEIIQSLKNA